MGDDVGAGGQGDGAEEEALVQCAPAMSWIVIGVWTVDFVWG